MKIFPILILLLPVWALAEPLDPAYLQGLGDSRYRVVESEIVGRTFHIYTMLPDGYDENADQRYPAIYVLDGGALFPLLVAYYRYLNFGEEAPDAIIVGISYGSATLAGGNRRSTDYTAPSEEREYWGGAAQFQKFLKQELIPQIETDYRARPDRRVIFGQSIGGQFVLYTALTEPSLFWGRIASNPALHRNLEFFLESHTKATSSNSRLFVASASNDDPRFREPALKWIRHWSAQQELPWTLKVKILDGHSHMSAPPASFRNGLRWLFADNAMADDP